MVENNTKTIRVSSETKEILDELKSKDCKTYDNVIEKLVVDFYIKNKLTRKKNGKK